MKVAYTMNGLIGGLGRFKNDERRDEEILTDYSGTIHKHIGEGVLKRKRTNPKIFKSK